MSIIIAPAQKDMAYKCEWVTIVGLVVFMFATDPNVHGFEPSRGRWIVKGDKSL
jgi:hypothetical protein